LSLTINQGGSDISQTRCLSRNVHPACSLHFYVLEFEHVVGEALRGGTALV
jgi:hypothetical protein